MFFGSVLAKTIFGNLLLGTDFVNDFLRVTVVTVVCSHNAKGNVNNRHPLQNLDLILSQIAYLN